MIFIPGNPISVNSLYRGRRFLTREGIRMKSEYATEAFHQYKQPPLEGYVDVTIEVCFKDKRKRDLDNVLKALLDAMKGILWIDDSQIIKISISNVSGEIPGIKLWAKSIPYPSDNDS